MFDSVRRFAGSIFKGTPSAKRKKRPPVPARPEASVVREEVRRTLPARNPAEIEADMERQRRQLRKLQYNLQREQEFARRTGSRDNQGIVKALGQRVERIERNMRALANELTEVTRRGAQAATLQRPARPVRRRLSQGTEAKGDHNSLAQAARAALKRGRFGNASERAIFEKVVSDLSDSQVEIQLHVLERLGELKSPAAVGIFRAAVRHRSEELRLAAMRGLLSMRHPVTRDILISALTDRSHRVRVYAVRGLYGLDDPKVGELLCAQLNDPHPQVRRTAATYLSWRRVRTAERHLMRHLHDEAPEVRVAVVNALGLCGGDRCVFQLICRLRDPAKEAREATLDSLQRLVEGLPEFDTDAPEDGRKQAVAELKAWWRRARVARLRPEGSPEAPETEPRPEAEPVAETKATPRAAGEEKAAVPNAPVDEGVPGEPDGVGDGEPGEPEAAVADTGEDGLDLKPEVPDILGADDDIGLDDDSGDLDDGPALDGDAGLFDDSFVAGGEGKGAPE